MEIIKAGINCTVKDSHEERTLEFTGSTETIDRQGEVILADGWDLKNYKKNPVILFGHDYSQPPVGKANRVWVEDGSLKFKVEFAAPEVYPFADTVYKLYKNGFMKATSVGFRAMEWKYGEKPDQPFRTFLKQELLELSMVPVPANPQALIGSKELKDAWEKSVISKDEWDNFSTKVNGLFKKEIRPEDFEALRKLFADLHKNFENYKQATDEQIKDLLQKIGGLNDKNYLDLLFSETPGEASPKGVSLESRLIDGLKGLKEKGHEI